MQCQCSIAVQDGTFHFFGAWVVIMTIAELFFLPETRGKSLDRIQEVWAAHWLWGRLLTVPAESADAAERAAPHPKADPSLAHASALSLLKESPSEGRWRATRR